MSLPWFRMYATFMGDPVIQSLAFEDQRHYVIALCLKCDGVLDRKVSAPVKERLVARALGLDPPAAAEAKRRLQEVNLVTENWQPCAWSKRQYRSDNSTERVRKYRNTKETGNVSETLLKRFGNGPDTDTDTDTDLTPPTPPSGGSKRAAAKAAKPDYPEDFETLWRAYPKRAGGNPKKRALHAWNARRKAGDDAPDMLAGVQRYARFVEATGKADTEYVMQAARFLGPDQHYVETWAAPKPTSGAAGNGKALTAGKLWAWWKGGETSRITDLAAEYGVTTYGKQNDKLFADIVAAATRQEKHDAG